MGGGAGLDPGQGREKGGRLNEKNDSAWVRWHHVTPPFSALKCAGKEMLADSLSVLKYQSVWPSKYSRIFKKKPSESLLPEAASHTSAIHVYIHQPC